MASLGCFPVRMSSKNFLKKSKGDFIFSLHVSINVKYTAVVQAPAALLKPPMLLRMFVNGRTVATVVVNLDIA